jgi:hypothetical protein
MSQKPPLTVRTEESTHDAVEAFNDDRDCSSKSEAAEELLKAGLKRHGYAHGSATRATRSVSMLAIGTFHVGATLILLSLLGPLSLLVGGVAVMVASLTLSVVSRLVIPRFEPELSNRLPTIEVK